MKFSFYTLGCKVNQYETQAMEQLLVQSGHTLGSFDEICDGYIINTCTVTAVSDKKSRNAIRRVRKLNPQAVVGVCGCYAQSSPDEIRKLDVDVLIGTDGREAFVRHMIDVAQTRQKWDCVDDAGGPRAFEILPAGGLAARTRALLKVEDGCNNFCTYCIIPYARGRCRSMPLDVLQQEVSQFAAEGYTEIVLCGINLAFYGKEWGGSLLDAVSLCCQTSGIQRVRLGSLEPERMTEDLLDALAALPAFCPQFHLSLQSGCDHTLKEMHRRYTTQEYAALCAAIRSRFPVCAITTDIMVGFPGETDADFAESLAFAESMQFAKIHVFRYSPRTGTPAAKRTDQISDSVKHTRMVAMQQLAETARTAFLSSRIGLTLPVLFERERDAAFHNGHTPDFTPVKIPAEKEKKSLRKSIFYVRIEESDSACCFGHIVPKDNANSSQKE